MKLLILFFLISTGFQTYKPVQPKPIIVQNHYYPKEGKEKEVYEWRLHASGVRSGLGLPKGRVLRRISGENKPYVIWECEYASMETREIDVKESDKSQEFKKIQEHMATLLDKFERTVWEINNWF